MAEAMRRKDITNIVMQYLDDVIYMYKSKWNLLLSAEFAVWFNLMFYGEHRQNSWENEVLVNMPEQ